MLDWQQKVRTAEMSNPFSFQISSGFKGERVAADLWYQYGFAEYNMLENDEGDRRFKDSARFFSLRLGLHL